MSISNSDALLVDYVEWHLKMDALSNQQLCIELLQSAPIGGKHGELCELVVERLCPGLITSLGEGGCDA